ncbi:MAG: DUF4347 domain-containing protein [Crocosphaera sp.]
MSANSSPNLEFLFIDTSVNDYQTLIDGITPTAPNGQMMVVTLDQTMDGIEQISEALAQYTQEVTAVHIVAHGEAGSLQLGNGSLNSSNLSQYQDELSIWGNALTNDGDILVYGCNVAEGAVGEQFVDQLTGMTGADIAASDDLTGNEGLGGDWDLEYQMGDLETPILFSQATQNSYQHTLTSLEFTNDGATDANENLIRWGSTINDPSITQLDFSDVTSDLTIKLLSTGKIEISRTTGSPSKIIADASKVTQITGTGAFSKDNKLDLSAITADTQVTITSRDVVEVSYSDKTLRFKKIDDINGANGANNVFDILPSTESRDSNTSRC